MDSLFYLLNITKDNAQQWGVLLTFASVTFTFGILIFMATQYLQTYRLFKNEHWPYIVVDDLNFGPEANDAFVIVAATFKNYGNVVARNLSISYRLRVWSNDKSDDPRKCHVVYESDGLATKKKELPPGMLFRCPIKSFNAQNIEVYYPTDHYICIDVEVCYSYDSNEKKPKEHTETHEICRDAYENNWTHNIRFDAKLIDRG